MTTPICDFVWRYEALRPIRLHMPGHKQGTDITEIPGADVLYAAEGIIRESEENAAALFQSRRTLYSAEGSSLCIRAMLYLAQMHAALQGRRARIAAGRNAHRVFLEAAALLDPELEWIGESGSLLQCRVDPKALEDLFRSPGTAPTAVYLTTPDYLGNRTDLQPIAEICHRYGALLLADNAHGAYLRFLPGGEHPLTRGADLCCDSAHKTLPVLTGGAYLHFSEDCPPALSAMGERAMSLFASTSPSYLILASLDAVNRLLAEDYPARLLETAERVKDMKRALVQNGWRLVGTEPLKLTLAPKAYGWLAGDLAAIMRENRICCEFFDEDFLVMMVSPENSAEELRTVSRLLLSLPRRRPITEGPPAPAKPERVLTPHEALMRPFESVPAEKSLGRILASPSVSCPPAVPILVCGERIDEQALELFRYYGITKCDVVK
ncbi:MAG: amino acid decarboxylase [Oscillospiraceae bacterium]|nr:amino acid decarboxylase [Oscillospiraceae bacterium]